MQNLSIALKRIVLMGITLFCVLATVFGSWSCRQGYSGENESITLGTVLQESSIPIFIAEDRQFFAYNGLNVTLSIYDNGVENINGLLNNEVDMSGSVSEFVMVDQVLKQQRIQTIGCTDRSDFMAIIARKDHGISAISDLNGKRIGAIPGTATEFFLVRFLTLHGLNTEAVKLVNLDSNSQSVDAIINGDVDAVISVSPFTEDVQERLGANLICWKAQGSQPVYRLFISRNEWISQHPGVIERFLKAVEQAEDFIERQPEDARAIAKRKLGATDEELARIWNRNRFDLSLDQSLIVAMEDEARWRISSGLTAGKEIPDFPKYIYADGLMAVKPEAVTIIR
jgi:NitT/TauT family transport system substrate-binding protein